MSQLFHAGAPSSVLAFSQKNWNNSFDNWIRPGLQLIVAVAVALAVLVSVSGLITRWMTLRDAPAWPKNLRVWWGVVGALATLAAATFLPLQALLRPFDTGRGVVVEFSTLLPLAVIFLMLASLRPDRIMPGWTSCVLTALWGLLVSCFYGWGGSRHQLLIAYLALAVLGVTTLATTLSQSLRLQVEARNAEGTVDAAASDYVLARLQLSGQYKDNGLGISRATNLTSLLTQDVSSIPAGGLAAALARIMYAIRPGLTWRALVTLVDPDRCVVTMTRNGVNVESVVISRLFLGLERLPTDLRTPELEEEQGRARAQLLNGAAAVILTRLSQVHSQLKSDLCGARRWRGVALQLIADEQSLVSDPESRLKLLREAVDLEPEYGRGRLAYITALFARTPQAPRKRERFVWWLDDLAKRAEWYGPGWETIQLQSLFTATLMRFHQCQEEWPATRPVPSSLSTLLKQAYGDLAKLDTLCADYLDEHSNDYIAWFAGRMKPELEAIRHGMGGLGAPPPKQDAPPPAPPSTRRTKPARTGPYNPPALSPRHAYAKACSLCVQVRCSPAPGNSEEMEEVLRLLTFALATDADRRELLEDPSYRTLAGHPLRALLDEQLGLKDPQPAGGPLQGPTDELRPEAA
jgi:hypothetical protein